MDTVIVTRHAGLVEWLKRLGVEGEVVSHADEDTVRGKRVYGVLPFRLAALADEFVEVSVDVPAELRGKELTADDIDSLNPQVTAWRVFYDNEVLFSEADARAALKQIGIAQDACDCLIARLDKGDFSGRKELEGYARSVISGINRALDSAMDILVS